MRDWESAQWMLERSPDLGLEFGDQPVGEEKGQGADHSH